MSMETDLPARLRLEGALRRLADQGVSYTYIFQGAPARGSIVLKFRALGGQAQIVIEGRNEKGEKAWIEPLSSGPMDEAKADAYIARARTRDPDLWAVEIEAVVTPELLEFFR